MTVASLRQKLRQEKDEEKKKKLQAVIGEYDDLYKALTASDKGDPLLPRLLAAENLSSILAAAQDRSKLAVLDVQLDLVGADSVTRVWFGFIKTIFSADVLARYYWFIPDTSNPTLPFKLDAAGTVDVLSEKIDLGNFAKSKSIPHRVVTAK